MNTIVAIVGRPNVGKSTLFNRLTETRQAIVDEMSGVTRDRHYGKAEWNGKIFSVIDTGGYVSNSDDVFESEINRQVEIAIEEAAIILLMVDVVTGLTDLDMSVARMLRRSGKNVIPVVNKVDNNSRLHDAAEFYKLGLGDYFAISSINGSGTGELLDTIVSKLPEEKAEEDNTLPRISVVGRPNVGKSSLLNSLVGEERNIVTPVAGTTRDSIFIRYKKFDQDFLLIDTAGLRKKAKVREDVEFYSTLRAVRAIENSDVCLLMIDATIGIEAQDLYIMNIILSNNKGMMMLVNKWDIAEKDSNSARHIEEKIRAKTSPFTDYPILFISAINKQRIHRVINEAMQVHNNRMKKISTSSLNNYLLPLIEKNPPPSNKGKYIKIKYISQLPTFYPSFAFFCNHPQYVKEPYKRYLENRLREKFEFSGVPIKIFFRKK
ncbi:MAG: ribosome biogenesis GTPase Der [Bacteroidales bacterium]|jgi:GTP-binding protein|nr:ribosome biogenesis GTPase Der [Bacteroidales bacterium]